MLCEFFVVSTKKHLLGSICTHLAILDTVSSVLNYSSPTHPELR